MKVFRKFSNSSERVGDGREFVLILFSVLIKTKIKPNEAFAFETNSGIDLYLAENL